MLRIYLIILLFFCSLSSFAPLSQNAREGAVRVVHKQVSKEFKQGYRLDIAYPEVTHLYLESTHHINIFIQRIAWNAVADFRKKLATTHAIDNEVGQFNLSYQIYYKSSDLISIKFIQSSKVPGEAAFTHRQTTFNFDFLLNQKLSELSDVFEGDTDYTSEIAGLLQSQYGCKISALQVQKYAHCCIIDEGLVLSFPTSPMYGKQEFILAWKDISKLLSNRTTVAALANPY